MGIARVIAALALITGLGCATAPGSSTIEMADQALREGEYERAYQLYEVGLTEARGDPLIEEKSDLARRRAAMSRLDRAYEAEDDGDLDGALTHLDWAMRYEPADRHLVRERERVEAERRRVEGIVREAEERLSAGEGEAALKLVEGVAVYQRTFPEIRDLLARAMDSSNRATAERLVREGDRLLDDGDALAAFGRYHDALALEPDLRPAAAGRERARKAAALRIAGEAAAMADRGEAGAALAGLAAGKEMLGESDPVLMESELALRFQIREHLRMSAEAHEAAGRPASALVLLRAGAVVDPRFEPELVRATEERLEAKLTRIVRIEEFEDGTGGRADPRQFSAQLMSSLIADPPGPWIEFTTADGRAALTVSGEIVSVSVEEAEPVVERKMHEHLARVDQMPNPARSGLEAQLREIENQLANAEEYWEAARDERESLERLEKSASVRSLAGSRGRFVGPYSEAAYYRILGSSRKRESRSRRTVESLKSKELDTKRRLEAEPYYLEKEVYGRTHYDAVTRVKNALAACEVRIREGDSGIESRVENTSVEVRDTVVEGDPAVELPADPDEMPTDVLVARQALDDLAARVAARIGARALELRRTLIAEARERERADDPEGALDRYAAFVLTAGEGMQLELANARGRIVSRWGIDLSSGDANVDALVLPR